MKTCQFKISEIPANLQIGSIERLEFIIKNFPGIRAEASLRLIKKKKQIISEKGDQLTIF